MKKIRKYIALAWLLLSGTWIFGQTPVLMPLDRYPAMHNHVYSQRMLKNGAVTDTVSLPFIDDFSDYARTQQPDRNLWMNAAVYINNSYPIEPRSNGVATFDALDAAGNIYQGASATPFPADTLTSCPIDLGVEGLTDVYLSFFYQPQGNGDSPETNDSLILQFKTLENEKWNTVWHTPGVTQHPFKQILQPVGNEYLYRGFQFRFVNIVSLEQNTFNPGRQSNADHWHIDYVRLYNNRSATDTATLDVAIIAPMTTRLKGYQSIPWNQLPYAIATRLESTIEMTYRNNYNLDLPVYRSFTVTDVYHGITSNLSPSGIDNIEGGQTITYQQNIINPFESTSIDSALFELKGYLTTDPHDRKENDTVRYFQFFKNYFARDDGSPESGYGFSGYNAQGCAVACRYETFAPDSMQAISIWFNPTAGNTSAQYRFKLAVWRDDNGRPGEQIYLSSTEYSPKTTGRFVRYLLEQPLYVARYYWIGWVQVTSGFLNVGFDRNYNDRSNLYFNTGTWQPDIYDGTLMIRPILGRRADFPTLSEQPAPAARLKIYPNPASHRVRIASESIGLYHDYRIELYDAAGRLHHRAPFTGDDINVSNLASGLYIVRLVNEKTGKTQIGKLLVSR